MEGIIFANISAAAAIVLILLIRKIFREKLFAKVFCIALACGDNKDFNAL